MNKSANKHLVSISDLSLKTFSAFSMASSVVISRRLSFMVLFGPEFFHRLLERSGNGSFDSGRITDALDSLIHIGV